MSPLHLLWIVPLSQTAGMFLTALLVSAKNGDYWKDDIELLERKKTMSKASIWARLKAKGLSDYAAAAIEGNMDQESKFRPNNVEDRSGISDTQYTAGVDSGSYTRNDFMYDGGKHYGYGLCQWTLPSRKAGLYDFAKIRGVSIADEQMQIDWMWEELHKSEYRSVLNTLLSPSESLYNMTRSFMCIFENPADKSDGAISYRYSLATAAYEEFAGSVPDTPQEPQDSQTPAKPAAGQGKPDLAVMLLQTLMKHDGYWDNEIDGLKSSDFRNLLVPYAEDVAGC